MFRTIGYEIIGPERPGINLLEDDIRGRFVTLAPGRPL